MAFCRTTFAHGFVYERHFVCQGRIKIVYTHANMLSEFFKKIIQRDIFKNITIILAVYGIQVVIFKDIFR